MCNDAAPGADGGKAEFFVAIAQVALIGELTKVQALNGVSEVKLAILHSQGDDETRALIVVVLPQLLFGIEHSFATWEADHGGIVLNDLCPDRGGPALQIVLNQMKDAVKCYEVVEFAESRRELQERITNGLGRLEELIAPPSTVLL
ncbi:MAG: hypothetical protein WC553_03765 [Patescibacteria group bacterium]|jgi:hypothetical protein